MSELTENILNEIEERIKKFPKGIEWQREYDLYVSKGIVSAVYILLNDEREILYIGQSKNLKQRINQHQERGIIPFTWFIFLEVNPSIRIQLESCLIKIRLPKYNKRIPL